MEMKVERMDHMHIVVKDIEAVGRFFADITGSHVFGPRDTGLGFKVAFDNLGIEFMAPTAPGNPIADRLDGYGEGLAWIGFKVPDLDEAVAELREKGIKVAYWRDYSDPNWKGDVRAARTEDPTQTYGVAIELVEYKDVQPVAAANWQKIGEIPLMPLGKKK
jgi:methylmalonyl-CoA/ethylmalonyl-CoA epimerase